MLAGRQHMELLAPVGAVRVLAAAYFWDQAGRWPVLGRAAGWATLGSAGALVVTGVLSEPLIAWFRSVNILR